MAGKLSSEEKRAKLARAAMNVIWRDGYHAATIQTVAKEAGLPAGGVFYRFPKKHDLALAAMETMQGEFIPLLATIAPNGTPKQRVSVFFDYLDAMTPRRVMYGCPVGKLMLDMPRDAGFAPTRETGQAIFTALINWLADQMRQAEVSRDTAQKTAQRMILRWQGAIVLAHAMDDRTILDDEINDLRQSVGDLMTGRG